MPFGAESLFALRIFRCNRSETEYALRAVKTGEKTRVAVVGASGYTGEELVRLGLRHPHAELTAVTSRQVAGKNLAEVFPRTALHPAAHGLRSSHSPAGRIAAST